jgi:transposase
MAVAGGLDLHRGQLTFDYIDLGTGESCRGRISPADRESLRRWLRRFDGTRDVDFAVEGCTGWRYVVEELQRADITAHLAEPAQTADRRGSKRRAKTDWADARHLRQLLAEGRIPESWIPPAHVLETRALVRLYKDLLEERTSWQQRVHATLFHQGTPVVPKLGTADGARRLAAAELSAAGRQAVGTGLRQIDRLNAEMTPLRRQLVRFSSRQPGCRALRQSCYGIGGLLSVAVWAELGDCRRFASPDDAVRFTGLDITVYASDGKRARGHIARQGSPVLRWALYEAALYASRPTSPDYAYFCRVRQRIDGQRALLSVARKLARRCYHTLRDLGGQALQPAA